MSKHNGKISEFDSAFVTDADIEDGYVESDSERWERDRRNEAKQMQAERLAQLEEAAGRPRGYYLGDIALAEQEARDLECD